MIKLGAKYEDKITGFKGVATGYVQYLSSCNQALLTPKIKKDGTKSDSHWIDEQRLTQVGKSVVSLENGKSPGFGKAAPKR